jgi:hypothetical protein
MLEILNSFCSPLKERVSWETLSNGDERLVDGLILL